MTEFRIETDSPIVDLRPGPSFERRAFDWLKAAHRLVDKEIADHRDVSGCGEVVELLLSARQADHLAMGLGMLASYFRTKAAPA